MRRDSIERIDLAPGFSISRVLTGLWQIADMERYGHRVALENAAAAMTPYVEAGFTTFDMADHYGSAEDIAGLCFRTLGSKVQLLTKWVPRPGRKTKEDVRTAVQRSLDRLKTDRLDLLQFHTWDYDDPTWMDILVCLQELKKEGLIRHLGLTNFDTQHLEEVVTSGIEIVSNQISYSLLDQRAASAMTRLCLRFKIKLLCFGVVAGGFLTERWLGKSEPDADNLESWSQMKYKRYIDSAGEWDVFQNLLSAIHLIAKRLNVSMANVSCRFILDKPAVGGIIIGARLGKREHIEDNARLFRFSLDDRSLWEIEGALKKLRSIPGDCGDEYRRPPFLTASGDLSHHV